MSKSKDTGFRAVILFKSRNSHGEIETFLFKNETVFNDVKEFLEECYTLTILHFDKLDKVDESNFTLIKTLDDADIDWHCD